MSAFNSGTSLYFFHEECGAVPEIEFGVLVVIEIDVYAEVVCSIGYTATKKRVRCRDSGIWGNAECLETGM